MSCTPPYIESANYCTAFDSQLSGWKERIILIPAGSISSSFTILAAEDVATSGSYDEEYDAPQNPSYIYTKSEIVKNVRAIEPIILKSGHKHIELAAIPESIDCSFKSVKGGFVTTCKLSLQNTLHNRGLLVALKKIRFILAIQPNSSESYYEWIGQHHAGGELRNMARILSDGIEGKQGISYSDDKNIEVTIECFMPRPPVFTAIGYDMLLGTQKFTTLSTTGNYGTYNSALATNGVFEGDASEIFRVSVAGELLNPTNFGNSFYANASTRDSGLYSCFNILTTGQMYWKGPNHNPPLELQAGEDIVIYSKVLTVN